ncbi:MAG: electron transporter [Oxalobacter sp.]|nr:MAG: electron transporter [Oxalobacter sp.]
MKALITPPFIRQSDSVTKIMADVLFALLPCCVMAWVAFGWTPVIVILVACGSAVLTELLFFRLCSCFGFGNTDAVADGSSLVTGTLLACTLAPFTPLYVVAFGGVMAVLFGKLLHGGLGRNRFNPALVGREFMTVFFPAVMTSGAIWYNEEAVKFSSLNVLHNEFFDALIFKGSGAVGEYSPLLLVLGGLYLLLRNRISWHIPTALTVTFTLLFVAVSQGDYSFSLGGVLLGAIYMATDMPSSASTRTGQIYYGAMIGAVAVLCIACDVQHAYMSYAILLLNAFVVPINWVFRTRVWGEKVHWPQRLVQGAGLTLAILGAAWGLTWLHAKDWMIHLILLYIVWSIGGFIFRQFRPDAAAP